MEKNDTVRMRHPEMAYIVEEQKRPVQIKIQPREGPRPANHRPLEEIEGNNKAQKMILRLETKMKTKTGDNKESVKRLLQLFRQQQLVHNTFQQLQRLLHQSFGLWARTSRMVNK